jgi:predicted alpha/beta-fold hydrolase
MVRVTTPYRPPWWLRGGHLQTLVPHLIDRPAQPTTERELIVAVEPGTSVRVRLTAPERGKRGTLLLVHGLAGSGDSRGVVRTADEAVARGWTVARVDLRNCGGTAQLASTLYNAAQSDDLAAVLSELIALDLPRPMALIGFSLGGNLALRFAGRVGSAAPVAGVVAVNAPIDLAVAADHIERPWNFPYQVAFTKALCGLVEEVRAVRHVPGPPARWRDIRTVRRFDEVFTAPDGGYASADEYYADGSSAPLLAGIRVPALLLASRNDPIVPVKVFEGVRALSVRVAFTRSGGHVGYWSSGRFWAASAALDFLESLPRS